jgi:N4-gp56 family major capsid protein
MATNVYGNGGVGSASNGANTIVHYYDRMGIKAANAKNVYGQFADRKSMPQRMGKTFKISKWEHIYDLDSGNTDFAAKGYLGKRTLDSVATNLANSNSAGTIAEGEGPVNQVTPKKVTVDVTQARYGFMIEYTDEVAMFSEDDVQVKYRQELGYLMNQATEDLIQRDMLNEAGIVMHSDGTVADLRTNLGSEIDATNSTTVATTEALSKVSFDVIRKGVKALVRNRAERNTEIVNGSTKIGTQPVNKAFYAIIGPEVKYDLETATRGSSYETEFAYVPAYKYAGAGNLAEGEVGSMHDVRFIESEGAFMATGAAVPPGYADNGGTLSHSDGTNFDAFPILFPTKGAFATVGLKGKGKVKFHSKSPEDVDLINPHGTKGFFSANMWYAGIALQKEKLAVIWTLATA